MRNETLGKSSMNSASKMLDIYLKTSDVTQAPNE